VWYTAVFNERPPKPYAISILGHAHYIPPPKTDVFVFDGEDEVIKALNQAAREPAATSVNKP
jgi:hypothetical protein